MINRLLDLLGSRASRATLAGDGIRFIIAGAVNTLLSLVIYQILLFFVSDKISWTISWAVCVLIFSVIYPTLVYKNGMFTKERFTLNVAYYAGAYLFSLFLLFFFVDILSFSPRVAPFCVLTITVPLNFFASRFIFTKKLHNQR